MTPHRAALAVGQTYHPANGERPRKITDIEVSSMWDRYPLGTIMVSWAVQTDKWGQCSEKAFRAWMRKAGARLL